MVFGSLRMYASLTGTPYTSVESSEQSSDYEAGVFSQEQASWHIRTARVTPSKPGAFVALWQRDEDGTTEPLKYTDPHSGALIFVTDKNRFGVFRFTKAHLIELGIYSSARGQGKRGFRVYPAWCTDLNKQASKAQSLQSRTFEDLTHLLAAQ